MSMKLLKSITATLVLLLTCTFLYAQNSVEGFVTNKEQQPVQGATVLLLHKKDSSIFKYTITDKKGAFRFLQLKEDLLIKITALNYQTIITPFQKESLKFTLETAVSRLTDVEVRATKPLLQFYGDKTVMNVDAAPSNAGSSLLDVLQRLPDVLIDMEGNISINGKQGAIVMIDGRETFLTGQQLLNLLRNMPASNADQLEIISNPSARYDASFTGGILNIKSKKNKQEGWNGNLASSAGAQVYEDIDGSNKAAFVARNNINYNYRKNNLNIYGNVAYDRTFYYENFKTNRYFFNLPTYSPAGNYFSGSHVKTPGNSYQFRIAADLGFKKHHLIGLILNNSWDNNTSSGTTNSHVATNSNKLEYLMRSNIRNIGSSGYFGNHNLNYKYENTKKNVDVFSDLSLLIYDNIGRTVNQTEFIDTLNNNIIPTLLRRQESRNSFTGVVFKTDFVVKKIGSFKLEGGYKYSYIRTVNDPIFLRQLGTSALEIDPSRTIYFRYSESIHALYGMLTRNKNKWESQIGLRLENADGRGYQRNNDSTFTRHWLNLFPSVYLKYNASKKYQLILNYSRKITRPTARHLSPFAYFTDSLYSNSGNPYLQPQFAHNIELRQIINNKMSITASYQHTNDMIAFMIIHEPVFKTIRATNYNLKRYQVYNLSTAIPTKPAPFWQLTLNAAVGYNTGRGTLIGQPVRVDQAYWSMATANNFTLSPLWNLDVNLNYTSPQLNGLLGLTRPLIYSMGIRKKTKNNLGSFTLAMQTPFMVPKYKVNVAYATTVYDSRFHIANQSFMLTYTTRFGKQTVAQQRNKANAAAEEQGRL